MSSAQAVQRVSLQPAYILHSRDYRDSSVILDVLTPQFGRVSLVARGVRQAKSNRRALLQPFRALLVSWQGRGGLFTLTTVEESGRPIVLENLHLACGYYMSELVQRLLVQAEHNTELFALYDETIRALQLKSDPEPLLRRFEIQLLQSLGLLADFSQCADQQAVDPQLDYDFRTEFGAIALQGSAAATGVKVSGKTLLAMQALDFSDPQIRNEAKTLMRAILREHLGAKPLYSRELFHVYAKNH
ncbi:MAG: DNA repair protein RecO [Gammaproteobacteria bacterium]|nr:DNA repair protein RecO [Gammaproteobacteria bacterium]